jgi:branched-chain amino acid transport system ATP-binding protein
MSAFVAHVSGARYGALTVLEDIRLAVEPGGMLVLLGSNGAGKTTSLRSAMGFVATARRSLSLGGRDLSALSPWQLARAGIVLVPDGARCFPNVSVLDNLRGAYAGTHARNSAAGFKRLYDEVCSFFPVLAERAQQMAGTMSGGQRQMLAVARALMAEPKVLLLDEPSAGLAPKIVEELFETLTLIKRERQCAMLLAEQNVGYAAQFGGDCVVLEEGRVALTGAMQQVLGDARLRTAYLGL